MFRFGFAGDGDQDRDLETVPGEETGHGSVARAVKEYSARTAEEAMRDAAKLTVEFGEGQSFYVAGGGGRSDSDLVPGVYEGGRKLWESAVDLVQYCAEKPVDFQGLRVLELGCGHALPAIFAAAHGAASVVVLDYNEEVLREVTEPNLALNGLHHLIQDGAFRLLSGDWAQLREALGPAATFDVVLSAETIYDPAGLESLAECVLTMLAPHGMALIAAKSYYFGVGGGTHAFRQALRAHSPPHCTIDTVATLRDGMSNVREVLLIQLSSLEDARATGQAVDQMTDRWSLTTARQFHGVSAGVNEHDQWDGPFAFVVVADPQFGMLEANGSLDEEIRRVRAAVQAINRLQPEFVVVCGDLTNAHPEMHPSLDPAVMEKQVATFKEVMHGVDSSIPLICVCGNHDIGNTPTPESIDLYRSRFGDDFFSFWVKGIKCIVLNNQLDSNPSAAPVLYEEQQAWFASELSAAEEAGAKHILVFQHIPWFLHSPDETEVEGFVEYKGHRTPNSYFHIPVERRGPVLELMRKHGVRACFAGHWHRNGVAWDGPLEMIITSAVAVPLAGDEPGIRIVRVYEDDIDHAFFATTAVPDAIDLSSEGRGTW